MMIRFKNMNASARLAIRLAQALAAAHHNPRLTPVHVLKGLMDENVGMANCLRSRGHDPETVRAWAQSKITLLEKTSRLPEVMDIDTNLIKVMEKADQMRLTLGMDLIMPFFILIALIQPAIGFSATELSTFPIKEKELTALFSEDTLFTEKNECTNTAIQKYCVDRIMLGKMEKVDPVIGRDKERRLVMESLCHYDRSNLIITGETGVGAGTLVEGLVQDIIAGNTPKLLKDMPLFELDLPAVTGGSETKTQERLQQVIKEMQQYNGAILYIDEIDALCDSGKSLLAAADHLLVAAIAQGDIKVIGTTTLSKYKDVIAPDKTFTKWFDVLHLDEPTTEATIKMLHRKAGQYEAHYGLKLHPQAISTCVALADRYLDDRNLPDAAFRLLDGTLAAVQFMNEVSDSILNDLLSSFRVIGATGLQKSNHLEDYIWLDRLLQEKLSPVLLARLADERPEELLTDVMVYEQYLSKKITRLQEIAWQKTTRVHADDVVAVLAYQLDIPVAKVLGAVEAC